MSYSQINKHMSTMRKQSTKNKLSQQVFTWTFTCTVMLPLNLSMQWPNMVKQILPGKITLLRSAIRDCVGPTE